MSAAVEHSPRNWFVRGVYPSCSCGYAPQDNAALTAHWGELGVAWHDEHGQLRSTTTTYTARFTPEAWIKDEAVEVDAEGDQEWVVSAALAPVAARIVADDPNGLDNDDELKKDPAAPGWVRGWRGPFSIHVTSNEEAGK